MYRIHFSDLRIENSISISRISKRCTISTSWISKMCNKIVLVHNFQIQEEGTVWDIEILETILTRYTGCFFCFFGPTFGRGHLDSLIPGVLVNFPTIQISFDCFPPIYAIILHSSQFPVCAKITIIFIPQILNKQSSLYI